MGVPFLRLRPAETLVTKAGTKRKFIHRMVRDAVEVTNLIKSGVNIAATKATGYGFTWGA
jgi:hypothetical protein